MLPKGFLCSATNAGIKQTTRNDLALIVSEVSAACAGTFTKNIVKAAPVIVDINRLKNGPYWCKAILANSGNANACTGQQGINDVLCCTEHLSKTLNFVPEDILMASTGVIGLRLPARKIIQAIPTLTSKLSSSPDALTQVAEAILTTDTYPKIVTKQIALSNTTVTISACCKGAGMIAPDMTDSQNLHATMLCFLMTDALVDPVWWQGILNNAVECSFNRIIVDGDTSTNDTVLAMANGLAGNPLLSFSRKADAELMSDTVQEVLYKLAHMIVDDGEGATKCVSIHVTGAQTEQDAMTVARTIASSPLVKTALYGEDPNWGRIIAAAGRSGITFNPDEVSIQIAGIKIVEKGMPLGEHAEKSASEQMKLKQFSIVVNLGQGRAQGKILTCDFSTDYIKINADYRT